MSTVSVVSTLISIIEYDERWPGQVETIASGLRGVLGDEAQRIDHIGSTSVPGLAAKDVIDVQVTVDDLDDEQLRARLEPA